MSHDHRSPSPLIPPELLLGYSQAKLTRREIAETLGEPVGFGLLLAELHRSGLPLPRVPSDRNSAGFQMVKSLTEQAMARVE